MLSKIIAGAMVTVIATAAIAWEGDHLDAWWHTMHALVSALGRAGLLG